MSTLQVERAAAPGNTGVLQYATADSAVWNYLIGDGIAVLHGGSVTGGRFDFAVVEAAPGSGPPLHCHAPAEIFVVLEGELDLTAYFDGRLATVSGGPGTAFAVPGGTPHRFSGHSVTGARFLVCALPGGVEQFFHDAGHVITPENRAALFAGPPDIERVMAAAQKHGIELWDPAAPWAGPDALHFPAETGRAATRQIAGEVFHVAAQLEHPQGGMVVVDSSSQPGSGVPMHCHPQAEVFYVAEGAYQFGTLDAAGGEVWFELPAGAAVYIPPNAPHAFSNPTPGAARCLAFFHGTEIRGFFELGQPVADRAARLAEPFQLDMAELGRLMAESTKFGMKF